MTFPVLRLLAKLLQTFTDRGCRVVNATDPHGRILDFLDWRCCYCFPSNSSLVLEAELTPFQAHYFSEDLVAPRIEHGTSGSVARRSGRAHLLQLNLHPFSFNSFSAFSYLAPTERCRRVFCNQEAWGSHLEWRPSIVTIVFSLPPRMCWVYPKLATIALISIIVSTLYTVHTSTMTIRYTTGWARLN
jgi:hypothetical protein